MWHTPHTRTSCLLYSCTHTIALLHPHDPDDTQMQRSTVVGSDDSGVVDNIRTSYGTFLKRQSHPLLNEVASRLAHWTHLNMSHQEDMQILRYGPGQKYGAHMDVLEVGFGAPAPAPALHIPPSTRTNNHPIISFFYKESRTPHHTER